MSAYGKGRCEKFDYSEFWSDSLGRAVAARHLAACISALSPEEALTCGLLSQVGRLALATVFPGRYSKLLTTVTDDPVALAAAERQSFDIDHNDLTALMLDEWRVPTTFVTAVRGQYADLRTSPAEQGEDEVLGRMLAIARKAARLLLRDEVSRDLLAEFFDAAVAFGVEREAVHQLFDAVANDWRTSGRIYTVQTRRVPSLTELYAHARERAEALVLTGNGAPGRAND